MTRIALLILFVSAGGSTLLTTSCASSFEERRLATIPEGARVTVPVSFSQDGRRAAYVEQTDGTCRAVCGTRRGQSYGIVC